MYSPFNERLLAAADDTACDTDYFFIRISDFKEFDLRSGEKCVVRPFEPRRQWRLQVCPTGENAVDRQVHVQGFAVATVRLDRNDRALTHLVDDGDDVKQAGCSDQAKYQSKGKRLKQR